MRLQIGRKQAIKPDRTDLSMYHIYAYRAEVKVYNTDGDIQTIGEVRHKHNEEVVLYLYSDLLPEFVFPLEGTEPEEMEPEITKLVPVKELYAFHRAPEVERQAMRAARRC